MCATVSDYTSGKLLLKSPWFNLAQFILFTGHRRDKIFNFKTDYELLEYEVEVYHSDFSQSSSSLVQQGHPFLMDRIEIVN